MRCVDSRKTNKAVCFLNRDIEDGTGCLARDSNILPIIEFYRCVIKLCWCCTCNILILPMTANYDTLAVGVFGGEMGHTRDGW